MAASLPRPLSPESNQEVGTDVASGTSRRRFLGFLIAGPTLIAGAQLISRTDAADASIPSPPEPSDIYDLSDLLTNAAMPTSHMITVQIHDNGTASFAYPRAEVGQGNTTAVAMIIAEELDIPISKIDVTLADARPELVWDQITGGSNNMHSQFGPIRTAAAAARSRLVEAAAANWGVDASTLTTKDGVVRSANGKTATYGSLAKVAAVPKTVTRMVVLKPSSEWTIIGTPRRRVDGHDIVTGKKQFAMDLDIPGAIPTMLARPPTINGTVVAVHNTTEVLAMPGVSHVTVIPTGVAVSAKTFGQCIDAVRALHVEWGSGTVDDLSDAAVLRKLRKAQVPMAVPKVPVLAKQIDREFVFYFRSNSPLETNCAVADVREDSAEIWSSLKNPIVSQQEIAIALKLPHNKVVCHVTQGGGSFGRHLFWDAALEAALVSQQIKQPVKLMWHRTDDFRHGRTHPMCTSRIRATYLGGNVLTFEQRHTSVATDFSHGLGEILSALADQLPFGGNLSVAEGIFTLTANVPYNYGITDQVLNEILAYDTFHTGSMRNVYSPDVTTAIELVTDELAAAMGKDRYQFRRAFLKQTRMRDCLDKVAAIGNWGRSLPPGMAQGLAVHKEYKGFSAALVEIDCRPATVNRQVPDAYTGPRVTKVVFAVDPGFAINPLGYEAQMQGGIMDGIAQALTSSLHMQHGLPLEGSWDNYYYTREWNVPPSIHVEIMPPTRDRNPGGGGEFAVSASMAATACAYAKATRSMPLRFPVNHNKPLGFEPLPRIPSIPQSPTDGLDHAY